MKYTVLPPEGPITGSIQLPSSKSISNRALVINALSKGVYPPQNLSDCDDTQVMIEALEHLPDVVDIKAAGTAMRFLTAYLSVCPGERIITGTERMKQRPIQLLVNALRKLGAQIEYAGEEGFPPLRIKGTELTGEEVTLKGNVSSQYISALLMIAPTLKRGLTLRLTGKIISRPYIHLTLQLMKDFGALVERKTESVIHVFPHPYHSIPFTVESDWSAASYWYQIVSLAPAGSTVELPGLLSGSYQGDSHGAELFRRLGVATTYTSEGIQIWKSGALPKRMEEDLTDIPDLAQTFVVTCALLGVPFRFTGLETLKIKETDRISALKDEMRKLGYVLHDENDSILSWDGERCAPEEQPVIRTYEDHRMAMAFAPAALQAGHVRIADPHVVSKSYPRYWDHLKQAGFRIEEEK